MAEHPAAVVSLHCLQLMVGIVRVAGSKEIERTIPTGAAHIGVGSGFVEQYILLTRSQGLNRELWRFDTGKHRRARKASHTERA